MTVPVQTPYTASIANGLTTVFPYAFKITDADDLAITVDDLLVTTGFTITGVGEELGGTVVFSVAPANGNKILRTLKPQLRREIDYQQFGDWNASVVNNDFDRIWLALQYLQQNDIRALKLPVDTATDQVITADSVARATKGLRFDEYGNLSISQTDPDSYAGSITDAISAAASAQASAAAAAQSSSNLPNAVTAGANKVLVSDGAGVSWLYKTASQMLAFLSLGSAASLNAGTAANNVVQLNAAAKLPAVDGSLLTGIQTLSTQLYRMRNLTSGTSYTPPSDVASFLAMVHGSTGGNSTAGSYGGMGGRGYSEKYYATPSGSYTYSIGAGGTTSGTVGGTTTFGVMSVTGGAGRTAITGTNAGGVGSGGTANFSGGSGAAGSGTFYGGSGAHASRLGPGGNGWAATASLNGFGGGMGGSNATSSASGADATSLSGSVYSLGTIESAGFNLKMPSGGNLYYTSGTGYALNYTGGITDIEYPGYDLNQGWATSHVGYNGFITIVEFLK